MPLLCNRNKNEVEFLNYDDNEKDSLYPNRLAKHNGISQCDALRAGT